jgi:adenylate kinase family enzyme
MEHERGATVDAHVADAKEHRTGRFADTLDPKGLAAGIELVDDGNKVGDVASFFATYGRSFCGRGRYICVPDNSENNHYRSSKATTTEPDGGWRPHTIAMIGRILGSGFGDSVARRPLEELCFLMQRVVILGRGGAGKSTFARKLGNATGLPVIELDQHFWQPGLIPLERGRWRDIQGRLANQQRWIMDGDLGKYDELGVRLQAADTVLVLDFSLLRCLVRALRRSKERMDFWWWLVTWRWIERPKIKKAITEHAASAHVRTFGKPKELERYLSSFEAPRAKAAHEGPTGSGH